MPRFKEAPSNVSFPQLERQTLERWNAERSFERSVENRASSPIYCVYDGPPFATGLPHYGHILTSYIKDVVPRYQTMRGYCVPRRWGWDCHGLPIELEAEKKLGMKSRADIVAHGIAAFNAECESAVLRYASQWRQIVTRLGRWVDFDNDYKTMDVDYMESVMWCFKKLHDLGLIYEGEKVVQYCTRCQTSLSNFEARLDDATRPRQDPTATVSFPLRENPNESLLAWTTTPWTLPANVALALGPEIEYVAMERDQKRVWLAAAALERYSAMLEGYSEARRAPGKALVGARYQPVFSYFADAQDAFRVLPGDFVDTETGTGVVHLAPAFGEDDYNLCDQHGIAGPNPVRDDGTFDDRVSDFASRHVLDANPLILRHLASTGRLVRRDTYVHNVAHCWRCDSPLMHRSVKTWFVAVTAIKDKMLAANQTINWVPQHMRDGRFGRWLEGARDWAISRNRFWGSPLPVWRCDSCQAVEVMGSRAELQERSGMPVSDLHRPAIDRVTFACCSCDNGTMTRVSDVLDCWFESGSMPYAQLHYPFAPSSDFERAFPGDFIVEYVAQTRGWFYTLVVLSTAIFDRAPFKNVVCHGVILADDGRKMSKRLKNYPDPMSVVEEHGSDALRIALLSSAVTRGQDVRFSAESARDAVRRYCLPLWNSVHFFTTYAALDDFEPRGIAEDPQALDELSLLDRYLLGETEALRAGLEERMAVYDFAGAYELIVEHVTVLSTWYIRLVRQQLWRAGMNDEKRATLEVLYAALSTLARLLAPFMPFLAENVHGALGHPGSVHLCDWPASMPAWRDDQLTAQMRGLRAAVRLARRVREAHDIKHRHPLSTVSIAGLPRESIESNMTLLRSELNVKNVVYLDNTQGLVDTEVRLDYPRLGKRLRAQVKNLAAAIKAGEYQLLGDGSTLRAAGHELGREDFSIRHVPRDDGQGVAVEGGIVVVLDLHRTAELRAEGHVRDLNRQLQDLRKRANLHYSDRVAVSVQASPPLWSSIQTHRAWLETQLLATELTAGPLADASLSQEVSVAGETVTIALRRVERAVGTPDPRSP